MFSCQYCEIFKNRFFIEHLRWLPMVELELSLWNQHNFSFYISWTPSTLWQNSCKRQYPQKYICGGAHSYCNFRTFKLKQNQFAVICTRSYDMQYMYSTVYVSLHSQSGWCFEIALWIISVLRTHLSQPAITCSKLTVETIEQGVKYVQS